MCDIAERNDQLVGYLYDELEAGERQTFAAHLAACGACRAELAGFEATRERMAAWAPPELGGADAGLQVVRGSAAPALQATARRALPAWGLAAAAVLVLAASAAIANLEVRVGVDGLVVRTGWANATEAGAPSVQSAAAEAEELAEWKAELARVQARLNEIEDGIAARPAAEVQAVSSATGLSDAEMLRRVREMLAQSETRQQREITTWVSQVIREVDRQRRSDLAVLQQGMGQYHGLTNAEIARQSDMLNQLYTRVATRQER